MLAVAEQSTIDPATDAARAATRALRTAGPDRLSWNSARDAWLAAKAAPAIAATEAEDGWEAAFAAIATACERDDFAQHQFDRRADKLAGLDYEGAQAAAVAATAKERKLIEAIYAAVPDSIVKCQAHADAETANDPNEPAIDRAWCRARDSILAKCSRVLALPPCGADHALRRIRLNARVRFLLDAASSDDCMTDDMFEEDVREVAASAIRALEHAAEAPPPSPKWDKALAAFIAARADAVAARARWDAAEDSLEASHPIPATLSLGEGRWYFSAERIHRDAVKPWNGNACLSTAEAAEKLAALAAFRPGYEAERDRLRLDELDAEWDAALARQDRAAAVLIDTPAPDVTAAGYKLEVLFSEWEASVDGLEADINAALTGNEPHPWAAARVLLDLRRLASGGPSSVMAPAVERGTGPDLRPRLEAMGALRSTAMKAPAVRQVEAVQ